MLCMVMGLCLAIISCDLTKSDSGPQPDTYSYTVRPDKKITIDTLDTQPPDSSLMLQLTVIEGNRRVFKYNRTTHPPKNLMDAGFSESVYFELPPGKEAFDYAGDELRQINTYYTQSCFCEWTGALPISKGHIRGEKISGPIWSVKGTIYPASAYANSKISFDGIFIAP